MQFKTKNQSHTTKKKKIFKKYQNHAIKKKNKNQSHAHKN